MDMMNSMRSRGEWPESDADFESWMSARQTEALMRRQVGGVEDRRSEAPEIIYTIPVVVHIIYQNETDVWNISDQQVISQIQVLNEDFRRLNADTVNTPAGFAAFAGYPNIEFCLARRDTFGQNTTGIIRHRFQQQATWSTNAFNSTVKPTTRWNPNLYYNIWIANLSGGVLGYAQFPTGSGLQGLSGGSNANTDGIVLLYSSVGRPPHNPFPGQYNLGRTATHEIGHALGLRHIWGDGANCSATDYCADTPPSDAANYGCPLTHASCGGLDMVQNYMDYTNDACMNLFTANQVARMWTVLQNSPRRNSLLGSPACTPPDVIPAAGFISSGDTICPGGRLQFTDTSLFRPNLWQWLFPGGVPSSDTNRIPLPVRYDSAGVYSVTLIVSNTAGSDTLVRAGAVRVLPNLTAVLDTLYDRCQEAAPLVLTGGLPRGGLYTGPGVDSSGNFNAAIAGVGRHPIVYTLQGCLSSDTAWIRVWPTPAVSLTAPTEVCRNQGSVLLIGSPTGGQFLGPGVQGNIFNAQSAGVGVHVLQYSYTDSQGCIGSDSVAVRVRALPLVSFPQPLPVCLSQDSVMLSGGLPLGGGYVGIGVSGSTLNLRLIGAGTHRIGYTYTDSAGCKDTLWRNLVVTQPGAVSFTPVPLMCTGDPNWILNNAMPGGGQYSGRGVSFGIFNPTQAGPGIHTIRYAVNDGGCLLLDSFSLRVMAQPPSEIRQYSADSLWSFYQGNRYAWYVNGTPLPIDTGRAIRPRVGGAYTVVYRTDSCSSTTSPPYMFYGTGILQSSNLSGCLLVRSPFRDELNLRWTCSPTGFRTLTILNSLGRIVHREPLMLAGEPPRIINTDHWSDGVYTLVLEGYGGQLVMRVVRY
jgi:PKD repeat protein